MKTSRREFIEYSAKMSAAALLSGVVGTRKVLGGSSARGHPNILLLMVDQQNIPPVGYGPDEGPARGLKEILGFRAISPGNTFTEFFPGYLRLRQNGVVLRTHYTASSACTPSRACIMTSSYTTGVDETYALFKTAEDVPWLDPNGTPTIGDWFQAAGYSTYYFGKWHVSHPEPPAHVNDYTDYLKDWGFSCSGKNTYPEPHGSDPNNGGAYRDVGYADDVVDFLSKQEKNHFSQPWFAVGSLVNPHDVGLYPLGWQLPDTVNHGVVPWTPFPPPPGIPYQGEESLPKYQDPNIGLVVPLNPHGFPQHTYSLPPTFGESLDDKPRCQKEYAIKFGLAFGACQASGGVPSPYPFQMQGEYSTAWFLAYGQFYSYAHYLADLQLRRMLQALDKNGLAENTIVVFLSDHGEMEGAHGGMIQKSHNAYEEIVRVPMVISSPLVNKKEEMREVLQPTSSIDVLPTLLSLAGFNERELRRRVEAIHGKEAVKPLVGADLSSHIKGKSAGPIVGPDGKPRPGVFYMSNDMVTENGTHGTMDVAYYDFFLPSVEDAKKNGYPFLESGSVTQPNNVRALCTGDWKIVQYKDPTRAQPDEWELYCLTTDPIELTNLVDFRTGEVRDDVTVPGMTTDELRLKNAELQQELARQEALMLG